MHIRAVFTAVACLALVACASTKTSQRASATASKRVYKQSATPRTSTPQARRLPSWPAPSYRAPSVRTYAAVPSARRAPATTVRAYPAGTVPPPPPPPSLSTLRSPRATAVTPARAPATYRAEIRPASRPARAAASMPLPSRAAAPAAKPIAPVKAGSLFRGSGSYNPASAGSLNTWFQPKSSPGRGCKT